MFAFVTQQFAFCMRGFNPVNLVVTEPYLHPAICLFGCKSNIASQLLLLFSYLSSHLTVELSQERLWRGTWYVFVHCVFSHPSLTNPSF